MRCHRRVARCRLLSGVEGKEDKGKGQAVRRKVVRVRRLDGKRVRRDGRLHIASGRGGRGHNRQRRGDVLTYYYGERRGGHFRTRR